MELKVLGNKVTEFTGFETFDAPSGLTNVTCESDEITSLCPVTGQPDWYKVSIRYAPKTKCVESKTLKLYLQSFRQTGLFCEAFADRIAQDLGQALKPEFVDVLVVQKPRGGVSIHASARWESI